VWKSGVLFLTGVKAILDLLKILHKNLDFSSEFKRVFAIDGEDPLKLAGEIEVFVQDFQQIQYSFDTS